MKLLIKLSAIITALALLIVTAGCSDSYQDAVIYFEIPEKPFTFDPQTASSDSELAVTANIYEGLLRKNASGAIVCGMAANFSKQGLTYTFTLRDNAEWSDGTSVTAADFVFGLRRAVQPETKAPFASRLFAIENAEQIYNGKLSPESLGISAPDEKTVIIKLCREDDKFEESLTTSVAMPCSEKFFGKCGGKYGLTLDTVISCGSYMLTRWKKDPFALRIKNNTHYNGTFKPKNSAVYITASEDKTAIERLTENGADIAFIDSSLTDTAVKNGLKTAEYCNICWFLTMNSELPAALRKSLAMLIGPEVYGKSLKSGYSAATSVFPPAVLKSPDGTGMTAYNLAAGKELFIKEVSKLEDKKFPADIKLYYYDNGVIKPVITDIVGHWQNNLGAFINIEAAQNIENLTSELKNQTLTMAVFPIRAESDVLSEYLENFSAVSGNSVSEIQSNILKGSNIFPLLFQNTSIAYSSALSDVATALGNGYIDFSFIVKTES